MKEQIREILQRFSKGECTEQEIALLEKWYDRLAADREKDPNLTEADEDRLVTAMKKAVSDRFRDDGGQPRIHGRLWRHAAIWIGLLVTGGWFGLQLFRSKEPASPSREPAFSYISTSYEEMKKVLLPDSTVVWLNAATRLSFHPDFINHREVRLSGEAFFEVKKDKAHPFVVEAGDISTEVLGTAFNVSAYPAAGQFRISLKNGRIVVTCPGKAEMQTGTRVLKPGQLLVYDKETRGNLLEEQTPGEMDAWISGRLLFYKTPLREAFAQIGARYGIHIVYDRPLKDETITARFENAALEKVLEHLSFGWDLHFVRKNDTLHVR
jgi:ferric-dicitrate binding protein FerR (iron transport regulator)